FDIALKDKILPTAGRKLDIYFYLNRTVPELERTVSAQSFALGCTPAVNLFRQLAEPIPLKENETEYHVVPDERRRARSNPLEIYLVDKVEATSPADGAERMFAPFFGFTHAGASRHETRFWHAVRRPAGERDPAFETYLTLVDLDGDPSIPA